MKKLQQMTKAELIKRVKALETSAPAASGASEHERLLHELQVHQIELETQNRELRDAQLLLEVSRDRHADLYDFAPVGYVAFDDKGVIREINLTAARMLGVERTRLVGVPFHLHVVREDLAQFREHLGKLEKQEEGVVTELRLARKGGGALRVVMRSVLVPDGEKKGWLRRASLTDITASEQAGQALRESEERLQLVLQASAMGTFEINLAGGEAHWNAVEFELLGLKPGDAPPGPDTFFRYVHPDDVAGLRAQWEEAKRTGQFGAEFRIVRADGQERWLAGKGRFAFGDQAGWKTRKTPARAARFLGVNFDITERKRAEEALRDNEARLRAVLDTAADGIITIDERGNIESFNQAAEKMFGYPAREAIGQNISLLMPSPHREEYDRYLSHYRDTGERKILGMGRELSGRRKDGSIFPLELSVGEVRLGGRRIFTGFVRDITKRRQAEEALRASEAMLNRAQEMAHVGGYEINATGTGGDHWSEETFRILGLDPASRELTLTEHILGCVHPEDQARVREAFDKARNERVRFDLEYRIVRPDASIRHVHSIVEPVPGADNQAGKLVGTLQDITERKMAEAALSESERRFRHLVETAKIIAWEADVATWRFTYVGSWAVEVLGYPLTEWFKDGFWANHIHPEDREAAVKYCAEKSSRDDDFELEYRMVRADGRTVWFHDIVHVVKGAKGPEVIKGFLIDITERKQAEAQLRESEDRYRTLLRAVPDLMFRLKADGTYLDFHAEETADLAVPSEKIIGLNIREAPFPPEVIVQCVAAIEQAIATGRMQVIEYALPLPEGKKEYEARIVKSGAEDEVVSIVRDVTERKRLEKEVLAISEREQSRIGQDLHDGLCQHLAGIEFRLLALKQKLDAKSSKQAAETTELAKLVRQGMEQTRTLARGLSPVMLEPGGLMNALQELATNMVTAFNISCSLNCPQPILIHNNAAATHLYRIAQEAIQNAIRHGRAKFIVINLFTQNDRIVLGVKDDGVGFPKKPRKHNGMGLRVMQYRAAMVGGSLAVQHEPDGGTSVVCSLRAEGAGQETAQPKDG